jgi:coenzyme F420-reducing hydrogenase gamma subunit
MIFAVIGIGDESNILFVEGAINAERSIRNIED